MARLDEPPPIDAVVGMEAGPLTARVDARWLMAYAAGVGERDPRYYATDSAAGPATHPLFPVSYEWPVAVALRERTVPADLARRSVHATHRLVIHRPARAGDVLTTTARVLAVEPRRAGTLVVMRMDTVDAVGAPVTTTEYGSVYRIECGSVHRGAGPGGGRESGAVAVRPPYAGPLRWTEDVDVPAEAAHVYTECARIWNPIHTDAGVARAAGLPGPILHGTATLALAVARLVRRDLGGDPGAVGSVTARFTGMVPLPSRLTVRGRGDGLGFDATLAGGPVVLVGEVVKADPEMSRA